MLNKIFGKKSGYYLELKEDNKETKSQVSAEPKTQEKPAAPAVADKPVEEKPVEEKQAEPVAKSSKSKKSSVKSKKSAVSKEKQPEQATNAVPLVTPFPVSATTEKSQNGKVEPTEVEFASKYLLTSTMERRRPGPSLNTFKNMARQVKKPRG